MIYIQTAKISVSRKGKGGWEDTPPRHQQQPICCCSSVSIVTVLGCCWVLKWSDDILVGGKGGGGSGRRSTWWVQKEGNNIDIWCQEKKEREGNYCWSSRRTMSPSLLGFTVVYFSWKDNSGLTLWAEEYRITIVKPFKMPPECFTSSVWQKCTAGSHI